MGDLLLDLHIHSVLSPCADIMMTPGNIIKKAMEERISMISITDHNSIKNVKSTKKIAADKNIIVVPGIEVQSKEDIHLLSYFENLKDLNSYYEKIYDGLSNIKNDVEKFGHQIIVDKNDEFIGQEEKLLMNSTRYSINELVNLTNKFNGIPVPSHADRSFGLIKNLGFIPEELDIKFIELNFNKTFSQYYTRYSYLKKYQLINNSDSHYLSQIEPKMKLNLADKPAIKYIFEQLQKSKPKNYIIL